MEMRNSGLRIVLAFVLGYVMIFSCFAVYAQAVSSNSYTCHKMENYSARFIEKFKISEIVSTCQDNMKNVVSMTTSSTTLSFLNEQYVKEALMIFFALSVICVLFNQQLGIMLENAFPDFKEPITFRDMASAGLMLAIVLFIAFCAIDSQVKSSIYNACTYALACTDSKEFVYGSPSCMCSYAETKDTAFGLKTKIQCMCSHDNR